MYEIQKEETKWLEIINSEIQVGEIRFAIIDFDGTISVIRQGWEEVMIPMMRALWRGMWHVLHRQV